MYYHVGMFNQRKYIDSYNREHYKSYKLRVKKDDLLVCHRLSEAENVNSYIVGLIRKDALEHKSYHYINDKVKIDFPLSKTMKDLTERAEIADIIDDYGLYMNLAYAIDNEGKRETTRGKMRESQWIQLTRRYSL